MSDAQIEEAAHVFKALSDPARLRLFATIQAAHPGEVCVCDLPAQGLSQATVSHHLRKLRDAGLVTSRRSGTWVYYRLPDERRETAALRALSPVTTA